MKTDTFGERLRAAREDKKIHQSALATQCGVSSAAVVSNWEKGINNPDFDKLMILCDALDVSPNYLLGYKKYENLQELLPEDKDILEQLHCLDERGMRLIKYTIANELRYLSELDNAGKEYVRNRSKNANPNERAQLFLQESHSDYQEMRRKLRKLQQLKKSSCKSYMEITKFLWDLGYGVEIHLSSIIMIFTGYNRVPCKMLYNDILAFLEGNYTIEVND